MKPLTRRAVRLPHLPTPINRLISAVTLPVVQVVARSRPLRAECEPIRRFDSSFTALWERLAPKFDLAVRRDAPYLNWRYIEPPHVRYSVVALKRQGEVHGYAVYRHRHEPLGRVTMLVDFLVDPDDVVGAQDAAALGRSRGARRRFRQGPLLRDERRVPPRAEAQRLLQREVVARGRR